MVMKKDIIEQEILLATTAAFFQRQITENIASSNRQLSHIEKLEEACWNGLLDDMLPEIMERSTSGKSLFGWNLRYNDSFIQIHLSESPEKNEKRFSIDPFLFLPILLLNS